jgi:hypothetical protein
MYHSQQVSVVTVYYPELEHSCTIVSRSHQRLVLSQAVCVALQYCVKSLDIPSRTEMLCVCTACSSLSQMYIRQGFFTFRGIGVCCVWFPDGVSG